MYIINSYRFGGGSQSLTDYPPKAAFALIYIIPGYSGDVIECDNGSTTQGFTPTEIVDGTLVSFANAGNTNASVVAQYDQTGNGNHSTESSGRTFIVESGALLVDGGGYSIFKQTQGSVTGGLTPTGQGSIFCDYRTSDTGNGTIATGGSSSYYIGRMANGGGGATDSNSGSPFYYKNNVVLTTPNRDVLFDAYTDGVMNLVSVFDIDFDLWTEYNPYNGSTTFNTSDCQYRFNIVYDNDNDQTANKDNITAILKGLYTNLP